MPDDFFTVPSETLAHLLTTAGLETLSKRLKLKKSGLAILSDFQHHL
jgi:hypothetical protein